MLASLLASMVIAAPPGGARVIEAIEPDHLESGHTHKLSIRARGLRGGDKAYLDGVELPLEWVSSSTVQATVTSRPPGHYAIVVGRPRAKSFPVILTVVMPPPRFLPLPTLVAVNEEERLEMEIRLEDDRPGRIFARGLPPGAHWYESQKRLVFKPDFTQGGQTHHVSFLSREGTLTATAAFDLEVVDTIRPIEPTIHASKHDKKGFTRIVLDQLTDDFTSAPPWKQKIYEARVCVPDRATAEAQVPVRLFLHGADAEMPDGCVNHEFRVYPSDPDTTYWWGYGAPDVPTNYTQRRILQLVEWVLDTFPGADPRRVYVVGTSMGGAGALSLGLLYGHHFAYVETYWAQSIPRHQRPGRQKTLDEIWRAPPDALDASGGNPWDLQDITRILAEVPSARDQFLFVRHGKDDPVIHFGAAVLPSELTGLSLYDTLESTRAGHYVVWDEAGHGPADPVMGKHWWDESWDLIDDHAAYLRLDRAFPAFSASSANEDHGDGQPRSPRPFDPTRGYAGKVGVAGDTGWDGAIAGAMNRWLRWDAAKIVDTIDRFEIPLFTRVDPSPSLTPPRPGYPARRDGRVEAGPIRVAVTPRRVQSFRCLPGERIAWTFGGSHGEVTADSSGAVTIVDLVLTSLPTTLVLERISD